MEKTGRADKREVVVHYHDYDVSSLPFPGVADVMPLHAELFGICVGSISQKDRRTCDRTDGSPHL